jgi:hypothetical protein
MKWPSLTTPPPPRPPPPKQPLFTTKFFSTKSFGPGHIVGAGILVLGLVGLSKIFVARGQEEADRVRRLTQPSPLARRPEEDSKLAQGDNERGQYGKKKGQTP